MVKVKPDSPKKIKTLKEFHATMNKLLIMREWGGFGDIVMARYMFEDFKLLDPELHLTFACPKKYMEVVAGHPFVDEIVDFTTVNLDDFGIHFNISKICEQYEYEIAPNSDKHRSDIWANHCGVNLTKHDAHFKFPEEMITECRRMLESYQTIETGAIVLLAPISAMPSKNLDQEQMNTIIRGMQEDNNLILCIHSKKIDGLTIPTICGESLTQTLGFIQAADYLISVDTGHFHASGALNKPTCAIFGWADGKVYGKYHKKLILVQRHRDNGNWSCGPCYKWGLCPRDQINIRKPCITEITGEEILNAVRELIKKYPKEQLCHV